LNQGSGDKKYLGAQDQILASAGGHQAICCWLILAWRLQDLNAVPGIPNLVRLQSGKHARQKRAEREGVFLRLAKDAEVVID
jgi:hypothetical protein